MVVLVAVTMVNKAELKGQYFGIKCRHCGDIPISWNRSDKDAPSGAPRGLVWCKCGRTGVDSSGVRGKGRLIQRKA